MVAPARHGRADHAQRRAFGKSGHDAQRADADTDIGRTGNDRLLRLASALGVEGLSPDSVLAKNTSFLAEGTKACLEGAALANCELHDILRLRRCSDKRNDQRREQHGDG